MTIFQKNLLTAVGIGALSSTGPAGMGLALLGSFAAPIVSATVFSKNKKLFGKLGHAAAAYGLSLFTVGIGGVIGVGVNPAAWETNSKNSEVKSAPIERKEPVEVKEKPKAPVVTRIELRADSSMYDEPGLETWKNQEAEYFSNGKLNWAESTHFGRVTWFYCDTNTGKAALYDSKASNTFFKSTKDKTCTVKKDSNGIPTSVSYYWPAYDSNEPYRLVTLYSADSEKGN